MATIHTIWQNIDLKIEDWKDLLEDEYPDVTDEDEQYDLIGQINNDYLSDERMNLDEVVESGKIIVIADLGLWNGRHSGYHIIESGNIRDCLYSDCDYLHWYVDRYGDMRCAAHHHDGINRYLYREVKPGITQTQLDNFCEKIYNGTFTQKDITRYTRKLGPYIQKIYGW